jgi:arsenate reductase
MAEGFMRKYLGDDFTITSAGLEPAREVNPLAVQVMHEIGIDISDQYPKALKDYLGQYFTYLITVCGNAEARCPIFPGVTYRLFWPFDDPAAFEGSHSEKLAKFREIRDQIDDQIRTWMLESKLKEMYPSNRA